MHVHGSVHYCQARKYHKFSNLQPLLCTQGNWCINTSASIQVLEILQIYIAAPLWKFTAAFVFVWVWPKKANIFCLSFLSLLLPSLPFLLVVALLIYISFLDSSLAIPFAVKDEKYGEIISEELLELFSPLKKKIKTTVTSMKLTVMLPNRNYYCKAFSC